MRKTPHEASSDASTGGAIAAPKQDRRGTDFRQSFVRGRSAFAPVLPFFPARR